ncbi:MAG: 5'/3'-nucleotidase SurE [Christensenellaceae bacterium]
MKILLTNDDGYKSEGMRALASSLYRKHEILVVAPLDNQSACSHSATLRTTQKLKKIEGERYDCYAFEGTPVDCIQFAFLSLGFKPDLIISGINNGMNVGSDILFSGTVAGAVEGTRYGVPSIAVSIYYDYAEPPQVLHFKEAADYICANVERFRALLSGKSVTLNINVPIEAEGEIFCRQGKTLYDQGYDQTGFGEYVLQGRPVNMMGAARDTDIYLASQGYITLTPLRYDYTDYEVLAQWKK